MAALAIGAQTMTPPNPSSQPKSMEKKALFSKLTGKWKGTVKTWFEPGKLADTSEVSGEFKMILGGRFLRHSYTGSMQGKKRVGEETIAYNSVDKQWEVSWIDDFHMSYAILFSTGQGKPDGFHVTGSYDTGPGTPVWKWRTEYKLESDDKLVITAYNIMDTGEEGKAVETIYTRVKK
jgi:hypothetical protein